MGIHTGYRAGLHRDHSSWRNNYIYIYIYYNIYYNFHNYIYKHIHIYKHIYIYFNNYKRFRYNNYNYKEACNNNFYN